MSVPPSKKPRAAPARLEISPERLQEFAVKLRDRRNAAGLSRSALAKRARLSDATIKFLETVKHPPSRATLIRLVGVRELGLTWDDVTSLGGASPLTGPGPGVAPADPAPRLNCLVAPTLDPLRYESELRRLFHGPGGHAEPWAAYHDPQSALAYVTACNQGSTASLRAAYPFERLAARLLEGASNVPLRLVGLGCGAGALEVRLAQWIQQEDPRSAAELCLVDQSPPLLAAALRAAAEAFESIPAARSWGVLARLGMLPELLPSFAETGAEGPRRLAFLLMGETLADLEDECRFFRHGLQIARPGDLLVVDCLHAANPAERDPLLISGLTPGQEAWLLGIGRRYWPNPSAYSLDLAIDRYSALHRGYAIRARARAPVGGDRYREFSLYRFKRYEPDELADTLQACGWPVLESLPINAGAYRASVLICRKSADT